jgi:hypothetical protein
MSEQDPTASSASSAGQAAAGGSADHKETEADKANEAAVQRTRAWAGLLVVAVGDVAIVVAAIVGIVQVSGDAADTTSIAAILSSAFTAIGTMTTAYFGIRAATNTAQSAVKK